MANEAKKILQRELAKKRQKLKKLERDVEATVAEIRELEADIEKL